MSFSKDGTKLASAIYDDGKIEIFDFNVATGQLSNVLILTGFFRTWGVAFSLNNRFLYYTEWYDTKLIQMDLLSGNPSTITASKTTVGTASFPTGSSGYKIGYLEYGPDSILYAAKFGQHYISAVTNPNQQGLSCGFVDNAVYLSTKTCDAGLSRTVFSYGWLSHCTNSYYDTLSICANDSIKIGSVFYNPPNTIVESLTDINGCDSIQNTTLLSLPLPTVNLGNDTSFCDGDSVLLTIPNTYYSVLWNTGSNANSIFANNQGTYWVKVSDSLCENSDSIQVNNLSNSYINIGDTTFCEDEKWRINLPKSNTYLWFNGSSNTNITITDSGYYWVQITDYCKTYTDSFAAFTKDCDCKMFVPNVFTPNDDNINDFFFPVITCEFDEYHIVIYNRWGQLLFESFDQHEKWDGKFQNQEAADGVYFYLIIYKHLPSSDKERSHSGSITLFR
jgi:gliding motility-associated-like protein